MIEIIDKYKCCGCSACATVCPKHCISMESDKEGFFYPTVDKSVCVECGLCERVCPYHAEATVENPPLQAYAAKNPDETTRNTSSSGGLFTLFAEKTIEEGGVVFGALFNSEWDVIHGKALTKEELYKFRGSKYVQSEIGNTYEEAKEYLKQGRKVLFSGTSCQIMGLKRYLGKEYENLLTIDVICHGVPSPKVWKCYLEEVIKVARKGSNNQFHTLFTNIVPETDPPIKGDLVGISFRDKTYGWRKISFALSFAEALAEGEKKQHCSLIANDHRSRYFMAFNRCLTLRQSCANCPAKGGRCGSDVTLADFWGIEKVLPDFSDDKGVSLCLCNTEKGNDAYNKLHVVDKEVSFEEAVANNQSWRKSRILHPKRDVFYKSYAQNGLVLHNINKCLQPPFFNRYTRKLKEVVKSLIRKNL